MRSATSEKRRRPAPLLAANTDFIGKILLSKFKLNGIQQPFYRFI